jgi:hypothetical protein
MKIMPEFSPTGRSKYFGRNFIDFWLQGDSGFRTPLYPPIIWLSLLLPFLARKKTPLSQFITKEVKLLLQILGASLGLYFLAHLLLLKLHFPSRYTYHSFRFTMALAAGVSLTLLLNRGIRWLSRRWQTNTPLTIQQKLLLGLATLFAIACLIVPGIPAIFLNSQVWTRGSNSQLYKFFSQQPKDILIASLAQEVNNLPAFSQRSVFVGREFGLPYHMGYYNTFRQRVIDLISAQYTPSLAELQRFIQKYGVDFLLLEHGAFTPEYIAINKWLMQFEPTASDAIAHLRQKETPALAKLSAQCSVLEVANLTVVKADCLTKAQPE